MIKKIHMPKLKKLAAPSRPRLGDQDFESFKKLLESQHTWPSEYLFKFIVPKSEVKRVENLFPQHKMRHRTSRLGSYVSLTLKIEMQSPDLVIAIYQQASRIPGLIAL